MKRFIVLFMLLCGSVPLLAKPDNTLAMKENERKILQTYLEEARDSLQRMITRQYALKQQSVERREADKEELDKLREEQTRRENELSRIKEERLTREQSLDDERKSLTEKEDGWKYTREQLEELFRKEADGLVEAFPTDKETRRLDLEGVRSNFSRGAGTAEAFASFIKYRQRWFSLADSLSVYKAVVMPEESGPRMLTIARFGNVLGYGIDSAGGLYYLRQTGRLGAERYSVEKIIAPDVVSRITPLLTAWAREGRITGSAPLEPLQNEHARMLIAGKKMSWWSEFYHSLEKGGWIMIPMLLLAPWAVFLFFLKTMEYSHARRAMRNEFDASLRLLESGDRDGVIKLSHKKSAGIISHVAASCVERHAQGRSGGERAVGELLALEAPRLNRSINTLAVIAGAAPLMGLLGTISGMITLFAAVTHYGTGDPKFLAGGISEALITAKTGLSIAIPVLFAHDLIRGSKDRLMAEIEKRAIDLLNRIYPEG